MTRLTRQQLADRLITGTVNKSYNPLVDIDWSEPPAADTFFMPPTLVSLYGTPMWANMTRAQQIELSRQELGLALSVGALFENVLNQILLRKVMHQKPESRSTQYALMEIGDETRHMVMFGRAMERVGVQSVWPRLPMRLTLNFLPIIVGGPATWVAALIGEEVFHSLQREMIADEAIQPLVCRVMEIHVTEEWRHIQFARDGLRKRAATMGPVQRFLVANLNGLGAIMFRWFLARSPYRRAGLDVRQALSQAGESSHRRQIQVRGFAPLAALLTELGLMGPMSRWMWRRAGFLPLGSK